MRVLGLAIDNSEIGFRRYVGSYDRFIRHTQELILMKEWLRKDDLQKLADATKIIKLDDEFRKLLSAEEAEAVHYLSYHNQMDVKPNNYFMNIESAFQKWVSIFFDKKNRLIEDIDPVAFGVVLKHIRVSKEITKTELARDMGIDRNTISSFENGKRLPPLVYMYKFSKLFNKSIDEIIAVCLNGFSI